LIPPTFPPNSKTIVQIGQNDAASIQKSKEQLLSLSTEEHSIVVVKYKVILFARRGLYKIVLLSAYNTKS
jgi:hypothetical protein